jgi:hypothetical protein
MARSADSTGLTVSTGWAIFALAAGIAALLVQTALVPFTAAPQFGLLVNHGDLAIYRNAARAVLDSQALYSAPIPPGGWFTYPPFAALCFVPLAIVSFGVAKVVWFAMSCVALWATIWRCWRVLGYRGDARRIGPSPTREISRSTACCRTCGHRNSHRTGSGRHVSPVPPVSAMPPRSAPTAPEGRCSGWS